MVVFPNAKINLGLQILSKRNDGFHDLETVFYPLALTDALEMIEDDSSTNNIITVSGLKIDPATEDNICLHAYHILKKDFPSLPSIKIHLHKTIPSGAGLGGGSADAAFTLSLLNQKFNLGLSNADLESYALILGSDCPFFIKNKPCFATGRGEMLEPVSIDLSSYKIIIVNPGIHISTKTAFSKIHPLNNRRSIKEIIEYPVAQWKENLVNDFEDSVFEQYPSIKKIKDDLYQKGALYASMSGSGSTVYGLFEKNIDPTFSFASSYFIRSIQTS